MNHIISSNIVILIIIIIINKIIKITILLIIIMFIIVIIIIIIIVIVVGFDSGKDNKQIPGLHYPANSRRIADIFGDSVITKQYSCRYLLKSVFYRLLP